MENYNPQKIEKKWQDFWGKEKLYQVDLEKAKKPYYNLMMFPYPSAEGLHVGNVYAFTGSDIHGRFRRMQAFDVFEPIGFDAFGIHSENFAIQQNTHPKILIPKNIENFRNQLKRLGAIYDWSHEVDTTNPDYYKWTQWLFLQLFKAGLAYRKRAFVDWCPSCKTVLADEQVISGKCERCDSEVIQKEMEQWFFKITKYAEKLLKNLDKIDWSETTKTIQRNWIGRSVGAIIKFKITNQNSKVIEVFTTRADTLFGCTYIVLAPEHPIIQNLKSEILNLKSVEKYIEESKKKTELERTELIKEKTGVEIKGPKAINPANNKEVPIFVADYVLSSYGTGAIMAVPAHDQRDFDFAKKYNLPIIEVISPDGKEHKLERAYEGEGILINSGKFNGMLSEKAKGEITKFVKGKKTVNYHLRDWLISRQRYWGPPIPLVFCENCAVKIKNFTPRPKFGVGASKAKIKNSEFNKGELENPGWIAVPENDLPVELPYVEKYQPTGTGESPLAVVSEWVNTKCPKCGGPAKRETDVSDTFLDSSWYFLRYPSTQFNNKPFDKKLTKKWLPVNMYIGGQEHACLHLLYTRFITMALKDLGWLDFEEPFKKFRAHGLITKGGAKMSKSRGNVVTPDEYFNKYGADSLRMYLMFIGPFSEGGDWQDAGIQGIWRFLNKVWDLKSKIKNPRSNPFGMLRGKQKSKLQSKIQNLERLIHKTIKKVTEDIENLRYNTAISSLMILANEMSKQSTINNQQLAILLKLLAPFAPHITEELWHQLGNQDSIHNQSWPKYDPKLVKEEIVTLVIQINGKIRDKIEVKADISEEKAKELAISREKIRKWIEGKEIKKIIFVPGKLINIVI
jgi:leucyl-tRNA synthetase